MNDEFPDPLLDATLRDVPLPADLIARLRGTSVPQGAALDRALRDVPWPVDFAERLRTRVDEMVLDDALCEVPLPANLLARLHVIPELRDVAPWRRLAWAACLMLVLGSLYAFTVRALIGALRPADRLTQTSPLDFGPLLVEFQPSSTLAVHLPVETEQTAPFTPSFAKPAGVAVKLIDFDRATSRGPAGQVRELRGPDLKLDEDVISLRWGALGAPHADEIRFPDLERIAAPRAPGIDLPMIRGYDRAFWLKYGIHPPVSPAIDPLLRTSRVPLTNRTDSLELTRRRVAAGRLPDAAEIRVEDFLAAIDYHFPRARQGAVAIRTAAGPALFAQQRHQLLQVGIKAGRATRGSTATHLTVAVDVSTSMGAGDRLELAKRAIAGLAQHAGPHDRISLIAFHHDVMQVVESLGHDQLDQLPAITASWQATGGDNLAAGLQQAVSTLLGAGLDDRFARNLVVLTDGQDNLPTEARRLAANLLGVARDHQIKTTFVQIAALAEEPRITDLVDLEAVSWVPAQTAKEVLWELVAGLTGGSVAVADDPLLQVEFNPAAVRAYRLVGHGTLATSGLESLSETITLHNDEEATALYEVWLYPNSQDEIAWVRAQWRDPQTGGLRETPRQPVSRLQFGTSVGEMPLSLQAAAVAAEIGKILAGSRDFELSAAPTFQQQKKSRDFRELDAACQKLNPGLDSWTEFQHLVELLAALDNVRRHQVP